MRGANSPFSRKRKGGAGRLSDHWGGGHTLLPPDPGSSHQQAIPEPKSSQSQLVPLHMMRQLPCPQIMVACRGRTMSLIRTANRMRSRKVLRKAPKSFSSLFSLQFRSLDLYGNRRALLVMNTANSLSPNILGSLIFRGLSFAGSS